VLIVFLNYFGKDFQKNLKGSPATRNVGLLFVKKCGDGVLVIKKKNNRFTNRIT